MRSPTIEEMGGELVEAYIDGKRVGPPRQSSELVEATIGGKRKLISAARAEAGQMREAFKRLGVTDPRMLGKLTDAGMAPMAGGATGLGGAAFMHNLPPDGTYVQDSAMFNKETERNDVPQEQKTFPGLNGAPVDLRISNVGVLAKIRLIFEGELVADDGDSGTVTSTYQWPWNLLKRITLNANGQTSLVSCEGMDLRARRNRLYRNPRDPVVTAPAIDSDVGDPDPGTISEGTHPVVLVYDIPISHDDWGLTGSIFAQSDQIYLNWRVTPAATEEMFTLTNDAAVTVTGTIHSTLTFYDVPQANTQEGRKVLIPDLSWLHGYLASDLPFSNTGEVKTPFIRTAGQLLSYAYYIDNGGAAVIDPSALDELRFEYGGNRRPRVYNPVAHLLEKNAQDYNGRILPEAGYAILDFEVDNPSRDLVYPKGVTELLMAAQIPSGTSINENAHIHFVEETLFAGR